MPPVFWPAEMPEMRFLEKIRRCGAVFVVEKLD
jgi:hypothetical protein